MLNGKTTIAFITVGLIKEEIKCHSWSRFV